MIFLTQQWSWNKEPNLVIALNSNKMGPTWDFLRGFVGDWVFTSRKLILLWSNVLAEACIEQYSSAKIDIKGLHFAVLCLESHGLWNEIRATSFVDFKSLPVGFIMWHPFFESDQYVPTCLKTSLARTEIRPTYISVVRWEAPLKRQLGQWMLELFQSTVRFWSSFQ